MKPIKSLYPLSVWFFRIVIVLFAYYSFFPIVKTLEFQSLHFFMAVFFCLAAIGLFVGGFVIKANISVVSALVIFLLSLYLIINSWTGINALRMDYTFVLAIAIFFFTVPVTKRK
jgi:hypothetical protein